MQKPDALAGALFKLELIPRCNFWIQNDWTKTPFKENVHFTKMSKKIFCFHSCPCYRLVSCRSVFSSSSVAAISPENWFIWFVWLSVRQSPKANILLFLCSPLEDVWRTCLLSKELPRGYLKDLPEQRAPSSPHLGTSPRADDRRRRFSVPPSPPDKQRVFTQTRWSW